MNKDISVNVNGSLVKGVLENSESNKIVILVHGFTGDLRGPDNIFEKLSLKLQQLGYAVLRFSFRGTPPSGGEFIKMTLDTEVEDLQQVIKYVKSLGYSDIAILGESMGGSVVAKAYDKLLKAVVFWYPALNFYDTSFKNYLTDESQSKLAKQGFILEEGYKVSKLFISEIPSIDLYENIGKIKCPVMFVHGNKDIDVPYEQSEKAFQIANEPKVIEIIKDADHCFENEQDEVIDVTTSFLEKFF